MKNLLYLLVFILFSFTVKGQNICVDMEAYRNQIEEKDGVLRAVSDEKLKWNSKSIKVKFIGGNSYVRQKVIQYSKEWEKYANISFNYIEYGNADIRISFVQNGSSWSYIGIIANQISQNKPTMNFGWFNNYTSESEFSRTILHEFGHALGLLHEHKHSQRPFEWNVPKVLAYYQTKLGWSQKDVYRNVINRYGLGSSFSSEKYDRHSIMHYPVPAYFTTNGVSIPINTILSKGDIENIMKLYPGRTFKKDSDNDGITDDIDNCPYQFGYKNYNGCPKPKKKDSDNDGITDDLDYCPYKYGPKYNNGCPVIKKIDSDRDGVTDDKDLCPYVYGSSYNNGCPRESYTDIKRTARKAKSKFKNIRIEHNVTQNYETGMYVHFTLQNYNTYKKQIDIGVHLYNKNRYISSYSTNVTPDSYSSAYTVKAFFPYSKMNVPKYINNKMKFFINTKYKGRLIDNSSYRKFNIRFSQ
ncbi:thrombospondin type 3 repeat-containing protein [Winogradskyella sp. ECml5-4]|uniref:thrombospondin type 3 repeat-containing protein n=1 Tax=Winogradskyella sp. ECml5-4 TaxID=3110975 RepID=UPI002FEEAD3C